MSKLDTSQIIGAGKDEQTSQSSSGGNFVHNLQEILEQVENSPQLQQLLMQLSGTDLSQLNEQANQMENTNVKTDGESTDKEPNLIGLVRDLEENVGGNYTISQVRMFMENNPEQVEQLSEEYL